jgi:hypothetical protein
MTNEYKIFVGIPDERQLGEPRSRSEDNIRMDLTEIGWEVTYWIHLAQGRDQWQADVNTVMNLRLP